VIGDEELATRPGKPYIGVYQESATLDLKEQG
jgi:hypothetical protein